MIELDKTICADLDAGTSREWLETNGIGGYAMGTVSGIATRRYHGLLVAATHPPLGRAVLLSRFEETLIIDGVAYELSANRYPGAIDPDGYKYIASFRLDPWPVWAYEIDGVTVEKSVFMPHGENTTVCEWRITKQNNRSVSLELKPLLAFRDHHHLRHGESNFDTRYSIEDASTVSFRPDYEMPPLFLSHNAINIEHTGHWYNDFEYSIEQERGFDCLEDLYQPCVLKFDLSHAAVVIVSTESREASQADALAQKEKARRSELIKTANVTEPFIQQLVLAADQFIVNRGEGKTVIAGYPWFSDWGRDTMIALPGLTLATGRPEIARDILLEFSHFISEGMLPNRFPDEHQTPDYNTVDATLWYFEAIRAYVEHTGDIAFVQENLYEKLVDIIDWHIRGTRYNIHVDTDGLLFGGKAGQQLTWMDAKVDGQVITPRTGKPVEIQALWYNALCVMSDLSDEKTRYVEMADLVRDSFNALFWNDADQCLYDVVNGDEKDASVRPNQIFAVSLYHSMLDKIRARKVVKKVEAELLTPFGLRTLGPSDPSYCAHYEGSPFDRDSGYHQGTVWAWLIGHFVDAYRRTHARDARAKKRITEIIAPFRSHLEACCLGQASEIFDAEAPYVPKGAPAQAWSVAELLRVLTTN